MSEERQDDEAFAVRSAHILGDASAAAKALSALRERRTAGEDVAIYFHPVRRVWLVGPPVG